MSRNWKKIWFVLIMLGVTLLYIRVAWRLYNIQIGDKSQWNLSIVGSAVPLEQRDEVIRQLLALKNQDGSSAFDETSVFEWITQLNRSWNSTQRVKRSIINQIEGNTLLGQYFTWEEYNPRGFFVDLPAWRGGIYDRNGKDHPLAIDAPWWQIYVDARPHILPEENQDAVIRLLCAFDEFDEDRIYTAVTSGKGGYHLIGKTVNRAIIDTITTNQILQRCVGKEKITVRNYPIGGHMSHVIGVVNSKGVAQDGIELKMDEYLTGKNGYIKGIRNAKRREIASKREEKVDPVNGCDVFLTLDQNIQYFVERALDDAMRETNAKSAWVIVQDPATGEILAMSSRPTFIPEDYSSVPADVRWNRAIYVNYEPGSTMKALAFAAGINEGLYATNSLVNVDPGSYAGRPLQDHVRGDITLTVATQKSSNRAASRVAMALGRKTMERYLIDFGFGQRTDVGLSGEQSKALAPSEKWSTLQMIRIAIGHGISVTGIQMVSLYSALANKGVRMQPYAIDRVVAEDGRVVLQNRPTPIGQPLSEKAAKDTAFMLGTVTQYGGTGRRAQIPGYKVAGKTGTAQIPIRGGYSQTDYTASFVGFFPADAPRVTILVALDSPKPNYHGGTVAAPVFAKIGADIARYLEIPPDFPDEIAF